MKRVLKMPLGGQRLLVALVTVAMLVCILQPAWVSYADDPEERGDGSENSPYQIGTMEELRYYADKMNSSAAATRDAYLNKSYVLTADIFADEDDFTPIGWYTAGGSTYLASFSGHLDGKGHTISNLIVGFNNGNNANMGLFARIDGGSVESLGLINISVYGTKASNGAIAGAFYGAGGTIKNCYVSNGEIKGGSSTGGLVGGLTNQTAGNYQNTISNSYFSGNITGSGAGTGGILGSTSGANVKIYIENCYSSGSITSTGSNVGGIVGSAGSSSADGYVKQCYSTAKIRGVSLVGGIIGTRYAVFLVDTCIALNDSITATAFSLEGTAGYGGRVIAHQSNGDNPEKRTNIFAWIGMDLTLPGSFGFTSINGEDFSLEAIYDADEWPAAFKTSPWVLTPGELPILEGLAHQDASLPEYFASKVTVTYGSTAKDKYMKGAEVTVTSDVAQEGYRFKQWTFVPSTVEFTDGTSKTDEIATFIMPVKSVTAIATYEPIPDSHAVTVTDGIGGGSYEAGSQVTVTAAAAPAGKQFKQWSISPAVNFTGFTDKTSAKAIFIMPNEAVIATAVYEDIPQAPAPVTAAPVTTVVAPGWQQLGDQWYHYGASGMAQTGWQKINGKWYHLGSATSGVMKTGWNKINGSWFLCHSTGGHMLSGWQKDDGKWYYLGSASDGKMKTGWQKIGGKQYYFKASGAMVTGKQTINGKKYTFNAKGALVK